MLPWQPCWLISKVFAESFWSVPVTRLQVKQKRRKVDHGSVLDVSIFLHQKCCHGNPDDLFDRAFRELSNGTSPSFLSLIEVQIELFEGFTLAVTLAPTRNVAMATMMTNFNGAHRELSNGVSTKFLSQIEVKIK